MEFRPSHTHNRLQTLIEPLRERDFLSGPIERDGLPKIVDDYAACFATDQVLPQGPTESRFGLPVKVIVDAT